MMSIGEISPDEKMHAGLETGKDLSNYFEAGRSALECIDVSSGGSESRLPKFDVSSTCPVVMGESCDISGPRSRTRKSAPAMSCVTGSTSAASTLGAIPVYSEEDPRKIPITRGAYDLIWVGSLLTHLDARHWREFLEVFRDALSPTGLLVFTTHGRGPYRNILNGSWAYGTTWHRKTVILHDYERTGFGFVRYPETVNTKMKPEATSNSYGLSLQSPAWVLKQLTKLGGLRVVHFAESTWHRHQDCFGCVRDDSGRYAADS